MIASRVCAFLRSRRPRASPGVHAPRPPAMTCHACRHLCAPVCHECHGVDKWQSMPESRMAMTLAALPPRPRRRPPPPPRARRLGRRRRRRRSALGQASGRRDHRRLRRSPASSRSRRSTCSRTTSRPPRAPRPSSCSPSTTARCPIPTPAAAVDAALADVAGQPDVGAVGELQRRADGRIAFADVQYDRPVRRASATRRSSGSRPPPTPPTAAGVVRMELGGDLPVRGRAARARRPGDHRPRSWRSSCCSWRSAR